MNPGALPVLGGILRHALKDPERSVYFDLVGDELVIDGAIKLDRDEVRVVKEVLAEDE